MRDETWLAHPPECPGDAAGAVSTPLFQTATFHLSPEGDDRYDYSRSGNPTRDVLEQQIARLERGSRSFAFASGMAALTAVVRLVPAGGEVVAGLDGYGGTHRLLTRLAPRHGIGVRFVDTTDLDAVRAAVGPSTRLVLLETPTNPLLDIADLAGIVQIARSVGAKVAVDASMSTPLRCRPLALGADFSVHSATKGLSGHSDLTAGVVTVDDDELAEQLYLVQNGEGAALAPFECWLLVRGLKTLALRLARQEATTATIAGFLREHPAITRVRWPGFTDHPGAALHRRQAGPPPSVLSIETGDLARSEQLVARTRLFSTTVSFGAVSSSMNLPCRTSHAAIPAGARRLPPDLVRISVGIEDPDDLLEDLVQALAG